MNGTAKHNWKNVAGVTGKILAFLYRMRKVFLAVPLLAAAVYEAAKNYAELPNQVGISLTDAGTFARMYPKELAVWAPFGLTFVCIVLMFLSRKCVYPWLVGLLSLAIPVLLLVMNQFGF